MAGLKRLDVTFCDCRWGDSEPVSLVRSSTRLGFLIHTVTTLLSIGAKSDIYIYDLISGSKGVLIVEWLPKTATGKAKACNDPTITSDR